MPLKAGQTISDERYRLLKVLGQGAMARVWLAEEPRFSQRQVAIKEPRRENLSAETLAEQERRFRQEVDLAAQLAAVHAPHVVRAVTVEELADGTPLLVMDYLEGGSLQERIAQQRQGLPVEEAVRIAGDVCQALQAFHVLPVSPVHRDIKPSNILLDDNGRAYLADFGLAQLPGATTGRSQLQGRPQPGTPLYMAPEQASSPGYLTPAADIYALGCVLFELLAGQPYKRQKPGVRLRKLRKDAPRWLEKALARALAEDPARRWQSADEFRAVLEAGLAKQRQARTPTGRTALAVLGVLLLLALGYLATRALGGVGGPAARATATPVVAAVPASATRTPTPPRTPTATPTPGPRTSADPAELNRFKLAIAEYRLVEKRVLGTPETPDLRALLQVSTGEALTTLVDLLAALAQYGLYQDLVVERIDAQQALVWEGQRAAVLVEQAHTLRTYRRAGDQLANSETFDGAIVYTLRYDDGRWKVQQVRPVASS